MDSEYYYILEDGEKLGPFTRDELLDRPLEPEDIIALPLQPMGIPAHSMPEFREYFKSEGIYFPNVVNTASYFLRLPAYLIDIIILTVGVSVLATITIPAYLERLGKVFTPQALTNPELAKIMLQHKAELIIIQIIMFVIVVFYNAICESSTLQGSIGKYVCGLAVVDESGYSLSFGHALKRNLGKAIYELGSFFIGAIAYFGYLVMVWNPLHQALHDRIAGCFVVSKNK